MYHINLLFFFFLPSVSSLGSHPFVYLTKGTCMSKNGKLVCFIKLCYEIDVHNFHLKVPRKIPSHPRRIKLFSGQLYCNTPFCNPISWKLCVFICSVS